MKRRTIYINRETERILKSKASLSGMTLDEVIRRQLDYMAEKNQKDENIERLECKVESIFAALHLIASDLGYTSGAIRSLTKNHEPTRKQGIINENSIKHAFVALGKWFYENESEQL